MTITEHKHKVLIPAAGLGIRLKNLTKYLNKPLIDISGKPAISRIINTFGENFEFVIVLGYKGELLKQFLSIAYKNRKFYFTNVEKYEGEGSGLGLSILSAEKYLQEPFIFCSCDTIVNEKISYLDKNIACYARRKNNNNYRTLEIKGDKVINLLEKGCKNENSLPYIGLAFIKDWQLFWKEMHNGAKEAIKTGESYPLKKFAQNGILYAKEYEWFDTGNLSELEIARNHFKNENTPNILPKPDESIWFIDDKVIKYSNNTDFIRERVLRTKYLQGFVPEITDITANMYAYNKIEGMVLSKIENIDLFKNLLEYSKKFWQKIEEPKDFKEICKKFYYDKTLKRIELYYKTFEQTDKETVVNGEIQPKLSDIIKETDWTCITKGLCGRFHGDFHFENILYNEKKNNFIFIDWRQNFGGLLDCGDIYYDLAKLLHGLIICHELIAKNKFDVKINGNEVSYSFERKPILIECENYYYDWLKYNGYDVKKVKILTALIYLNIASLHHYPYCHLLYYLGKTMLKEN